MATTRLVTADELLAMGEDDRYELVDGVLVPMSPPPGFQHGRITMRLGTRVTNFVDAHRLGSTTGAETGFRLRRNPDLVRAADFAFVARGRITPDMDLRRYLDLAPDLVVEVVSPGDARADVAAKVQQYLDAGVRLVWAVYPPSNTVIVHRLGQPPLVLGESDQLSGEDVLPGFTCLVAELFADPEAE